jgi:hypothetical protein
MAIGCGLPLVALVVLPAMGVAWGTTLFFIVLLLCPLMHLFGMHGSHDQPRSKRRYGPNKEE